MELDWWCPCDACNGTLEPPEPDPEEFERWLVWRDIVNVIDVIEIHNALDYVNHMC